MIDRRRRFALALLVLAAALAPWAGALGATEDSTIGTRATFTAPEHAAASFRSIDRILFTRSVPTSGAVAPLAPATQPLDVRYSYGGADRSIDELVERTDTTGLLVVHDGAILYEGYFQGADETSRFLSMSVGKSFVSTLVGLAIGEGLIASVDDPVTRYLPELRGSGWPRGVGGGGYDGVSIEHVLQMSSGVDFTEEYDDPESDVFRLFAPLSTQQGRLNEVASSFGRAREPGSKFYYASNDTQILGMLVARVSGNGMEMAFGGLNVTLRDYGRFGLLMAYGGRWRGEQLLPEGWVERATVPRSAQVEHGRLYPGYPLGYGYQWWCFPGPGHAFTGQGVFGQLLLVDPTLDLVVVKTSAWPVAWDDAKEAESYAFFDAVRAALRERGGR